jgi:hypothetical protein
METNWDIIVAGGGTSGAAAAISAARSGCKVLVIEKNTFLGGTATGSLVTPMMNNKLQIGEYLTKGLPLEVLKRLQETGDSATFKKENPGWFNPEMMKCVLDDFCEESGVEVLFDTVVLGAEVENKNITKIKCHNKGGEIEFSAKYFIDATGDADLAAYAGVPFESEEHQTMSLRFVMTNVDLDEFARWMSEIDADFASTSIDYSNYEAMLLTAAHTWDNHGWKLRPFFGLAVRDGILLPEDAAYFQFFSIPGQKNAVALNCPRISARKQLDPLNPEDLSYAYKQGRKQMRRLAKFCITYLAGFEEAYISQIAPQLGVRDSRRIKGKYKLTEEDILRAKKFENAVAKSNYPVDVHAREKGKNELIHLPPNQYYEIPLESLTPENIDNLLVVGRCISTTFRAQASIRIMPNCWSMGEYAGKHLAEKVTSSASI